MLSIVVILMWRLKENPSSPLLGTHKCSNLIFWMAQVFSPLREKTDLRVVRHLRDDVQPIKIHQLFK